ncbi:MAG: phosphatase PAP2 family protein [bacterium]
MIPSQEATLETEIKAEEVSVFSRFWQVLLIAVALLGVDFVFLMGMTLLLTTLVHVMDGHIRWFQTSMGLPLAILSLAILYDFGKFLYFLIIHKKNQARQFLAQIPVILRDWTPFLLVDFIYENLHDLSGRFNHHDIAALLYRGDLALFGVEPTLWMQKFTTTFLTDVMAILYAPYLAYPLILMLLLSLSSRRNQFQQISIAVCFTFLLGFVCYVLFPAQPPRFYLEHVFTNPPHLNGSFIYYHLQGVWDNLSAVRGAAFPSLHAAISSVALIYAFRFRNLSWVYRFLFYAYIPLVVGLWISTVYLRHHWVIDLFAGGTVAILASLLSDRVIRFSQKLRLRLGIS